MSSSLSPPIYLDHAATSPCPDHLLDRFVDFQKKYPWNSETVYESGLETKQQLEKARQSLGRHLGVASERCVFTSGGTEGNNFALHLLSNQVEPGVLWLSKTVHPSQGEACKALEQRGWELVLMPTKASGAIDVQKLEALPAPKLIAAEWVNSEVGFIQNIEALLEYKGKHKALIWIDGVQGLGKCKLPKIDDIDAFVVSGHKLGTPIGVGAVVINTKLKKHPLFHGGGQENAWRSGTVSVPLILTFVEALNESLAGKVPPFPDMPESWRAYRGEGQDYSPNIFMLNVAPVDGEILLHQLAAEGISVGLGSACRASRKKISATHQSMGLNEQQSRQTLRISTCIRSTSTELQWAMDRLETLWKESKRFYR